MSPSTATASTSSRSVENGFRPCAPAERGRGSSLTERPDSAIIIGLALEAWMTTRYAFRLQITGADSLQRLVTTPSFAVDEREYSEIVRLLALNADTFASVTSEGRALAIAKMIRPADTSVEIVGVRNLS